MNSISPQPMLLVVEDSDEDFEALRRALKKASFSYPVIRHADADAALHWIRTETQFTGGPSRLGLVLLDLNMPGTDGRDLLAQLKADKEFMILPIVILTTSNNPQDITMCYRQGANSYLIKSVDLQAFQHTVDMLCAYWFDVVCLPN